jgi:single-stranded-DNA-specific exonuclease
MKKRWLLKEVKQNLIELPEYPNLILRLLALRGINSEEQIKEFLEPDFAKLHDPFLFSDMQKAVTRIREAVEQKQNITIYADYDADAITASATVYLALRKLGAEVDYYIPDRFTEGYGLNIDAIKSICAKSNLIITVDCGINAVEEARVCKNLGVDLIITDHHDLTAELPGAFAVVNPKNPHDEYPFPYLTGVGVAFKLVQALDLNGWEKWLLDLVALGTVADCQSLSGENRILVSFGLKVLSKTKWIGMKALLARAGLKSDIYDAFTLGFILAPRVNAAGRIKHADIAFKLLISENPQEAEALAQELDELNKHRQMLTDQITSEAKGQIELIADKKVLLAKGSDWPKGVVGLVAGRLAEEFNRPVLALSMAEGVATGSARSVGNFNIVEALGFAKETLIKYGGHPQAAGFTLASDNIPSLHQKLLEYAESLDLSLGDPVLEIDAEVSAEDMTWDNLGFLEKFGPFGFGNPKPKLVGYGLEVIEMRLVGAQNQHLKMKVRFGENALEAMAFSKGFMASSLQIGKKIDIVFELTSNEWNGNRSMQLRVIDIVFTNN